jgi:hypothetical protein
VRRLGRLILVNRRLFAKYMARHNRVGTYRRRKAEVVA